MGFAGKLLEILGASDALQKNPIKSSVLRCNLQEKPRKSIFYWMVFAGKSSRESSTLRCGEPLDKNRRNFSKNVEMEFTGQS